MSHPGHIVVRVGNTVANFYRHSGSETVTGLALLEAIAIAPDYKERSYFEDGEQVIKILMEIESPLASMNTTKGNFVRCDFRLVGGDIGMSFEYGFMLESIRGTGDADYAEHKGWRIHYNKHVDAGDILDDWLQGAEVFTPKEMAAHLIKNIDGDSYLFDNREAVEAALFAVSGRLPTP